VNGIFTFSSEYDHRYLRCYIHRYSVIYICVVDETLMSPDRRIRIYTWGETVPPSAAGKRRK